MGINKIVLECIFTYSFRSISAQMKKFVRELHGPLKPKKKRELPLILDNQTRALLSMELSKQHKEGRCSGIFSNLSLQ